MAAMAAFAVIATSDVFGGWEDVGAPATRRSGAAVSVTPAHSATPVRTAPATSAPATSSETVREAAARRAAARDAATRARAERERALLEEEQRRIDARARAAQRTATAPRTAPAQQPRTPAPRAYAAPQPRTATHYAGTPAPAAEDWENTAYGEGGDAFFIPFFDARRESDTWLHGIYMAPVKAPNGNDLTMAEGQFHHLMVYARDFLAGDFAMAANLRGTGFIDDAEYETLPYVLLDFDIDVSMAWRFVNDFSLELGARPGIYGDPENFDASLFSVPFRGCLYYSFSPEFAIRAGAEGRPGWDMAVMPLAGFGWSPSEYFYLEAGVPRTTATLHLGPIDFYGLAQWENTTYAMEDKKGKPENLTLDYWRVGGGLTINFFDAFRIGGEAGYILGREFTAEGKDGEGTIKLKNSPYFGATLGARF